MKRKLFGMSNKKSECPTKKNAYSTFLVVKRFIRAFYTFGIADRRWNNRRQLSFLEFIYSIRYSWKVVRPHNNTTPTYREVAPGINFFFISFL
jgi:hypothetical protein